MGDTQTGVDTVTWGKAKPMRPEHSAQKPNIRRFHRALTRLGLDVDALYEELGLSAAVIDDEGASLSMAKYLALLELAADQNGKPFLGVELAFYGANNDIGILGYMLRNAPTLEKALDLLHRFIALLSPGSNTELVVEAPLCVLTYGFRDHPPPRCRQDVEGTIAQFVLMIRAALGDDSWDSPRLYFAHPPPALDDLTAFPLGGELIFDHSFSGMCFPREFLPLANRDFDPELLAVLESQMQQTANNLTESESFLDHVRLVISSRLGDANVGADFTAAELGMSRRTLHRRLREFGTTFNALRESIVLQIAKESLAGTSLSITDLALDLGYSDTSAFDRAFKRLTNTTPLAYRRMHRER